GFGRRGFGRRGFARLGLGGGRRRRLLVHRVNPGSACNRSMKSGIEHGSKEFGPHMISSPTIRRVVVVISGGLTLVSPSNRVTVVVVSPMARSATKSPVKSALSN